MPPLLPILAAGGVLLAAAAVWFVWRRVSGDATRLGGVHPNRPLPHSGEESGPAPTRRPRTVEDLVRSGHLIEAIQRIREQTGLGLAEAKDRVDFFKAHGRWPEAATPQAAPRATDLPGLQATGLEALIRQGNLIQAIKLAREQNPGMDLKTAKELVEALAARMR